MSDGPILYGALAEWWPLLSAPADYEGEAAVYVAALREAVDGVPRSLLELGSGGGNNASYMKDAFDEVVLVDLSPGMVEVSRRLNPDCAHHVGDMRTVRLDRTFDCVFVHDAVSYMTTPEDLRAAVHTAWLHCAPGGAALFAPDFVTETFVELTGTGGHDGPDGRALRYLSWSRDPDPSDHTFVTDYAYLLRHADGRVEAHHDRHVEGLFPTEFWITALTDAGFRVEARREQHDDVTHESMLFVARRGHE